MDIEAISLIEKKPHPDGGTCEFLKSLEVFLIKSEARTLLLENIIQQNEVSILLQIQNNQLTTLLDCTGVSPYEIWYFDEKFQFTGKAYSLNEGKGTFQIQTQAKWALFIHLGSKDFDDLKNFNCSELDITDKYNIVERAFPYGYGLFPYLIVKQEKSPCFSQIPIKINPLEKDNLVGHTLDKVPDDVINNSNLLLNLLQEHAFNFYLKLKEERDAEVKLCLVIDKDEAYYYHKEGVHVFNKSIPFGGVLLNISGGIIARNTKHYLLDYKQKETA